MFLGPFTMVVIKQKLPNIKLHESRNSENQDKRDGLIQTSISVDIPTTKSPEWALPPVPASRPTCRVESLRDDDEYINLRNKNRPKVEWSDEEMEALLWGVEHYGEGNWSRILSGRSGVFHRERRVIDLVNKYKQHLKASSFYTAAKRRWLYVNEEGEPKLNHMSEPVVFLEKFPYTVATKIAKRLNLQEGEMTEIIIQEMKDAKSIHYYRAGVYGRRLKVKKIVPLH